MISVWTCTILLKDPLVTKNFISIFSSYPGQKVHPDSYRNALEHGSSISVTDPVTGFSRFRSKPIAKYSNRIPASSLLHFSTGSDREMDSFLRVFPEKPREYCFRKHRPGYRRYVFDVATMINSSFIQGHQGCEILEAGSQLHPRRINPTTDPIRSDLLAKSYGNSSHEYVGKSMFNYFCSNYYLEPPIETATTLH